MKKKLETAYGVIGLGALWRSFGNDLAKSGNEVIVVDKDEKKSKRDAPVYRLCFCNG